ncbi:unnamed protein product [Acanthoscelides obtectus]|uniref:U5 small nuclear ribonucleoprotein TSSC4 n=1 Tax=Acanthoscelides obtectus TaxID=200917 RepID=A0A9P0PXE5_ACAOB|nr:unnamed protein product [Acanthoscelides obtectus]CAK1668453.1 Protein TSSC4 [Acanthoscelides obtectus]
MDCKSSDKAFTLKSPNEEFTQRQKSVFDRLNVLDHSRKLVTSTDPDDIDVDKTNNKKQQRSQTKHLRGKESIFKQPQNPIPKGYLKRMPDFKKNPHKWIRYSLDDVRDEDISDKGNTRAALSFLKELKDRKKSEEMETDDDLPTKIVFKRHTPVPKVSSTDETDKLKASFSGSKIVMPEYVPGQKIKKEKKKRFVERGRELKLDHLDALDEEEEQ